MEPVRLGIVGLGVMGRDHLKHALRQADVLRVVGCADRAADARSVAESHGVPAFEGTEQLLDHGVEALLVATPHPQHEADVLAAAARGVHVLCEKPIAATVSAADRMLAACRRHRVVLGIDFTQRASPLYRTMRRLLDAGTIGGLTRVSLVATSWYRTQAYYDSAAWRGTWEGEGGGVLMNQAPHNMDMYLQLAGQPLRVKASVATRIHRIETENTASALLEHEGGRIDTFTTTTAEWPGTTEWTFVGDRGTIHSDGRSIRLYRVAGPVSQHLLEAPHGSRPSGAWEDVPLDDVAADETGHVGVVRQFARAVREGIPPLASGEDGVLQLELANAIIFAALRDRSVELPIEREAYDGLLQELRRQREV